MPIVIKADGLAAGKGVFIVEEEETALKLINDLFTGRSLDFLNRDANLLAIDFLVVADSRLGEESDPILLEQKLSNWEVKARFDSADKLKHMGMIVLKSKQSLLMFLYSLLCSCNKIYS